MKVQFKTLVYQAGISELSDMDPEYSCMNVYSG